MDFILSNYINFKLGNNFIDSNMKSWNLFEGKPSSFSNLYKNHPESLKFLILGLISLII